VSFNAATVGSFYNLVSSIKDKSPDGLLILANSIDTALVCQQAMKLNLSIPKFATGWSYSGKLITYGGRSVEGLVIVQSADLKKDRQEVRRFMKTFRDRYYVDPTFPAVHAYDATRLGLHALKKQGADDGLKQKLLSVESFPGILQDFALDEYGDVVNPPIYFMKVDEAVFHSL
jgi:branched-chain amino acid transport system substrate-binding protein